MGNCLFLCARGWGIGRQVHKCPGVCPGGMVTGRIEPRISELESERPDATATRSKNLLSEKLSRFMRDDESNDHPTPHI